MAPRIFARVVRAAVLFLSWALHRVRPLIHGEARWMPWWDRWLFLRPKKPGLWLSPRARLSLTDSFSNLILVAPTGSGKTTRFVIPNVLQAAGSVVVTDPAGEIFRATSGHLRDRGYRIQVIQPIDLSRSARFNPLHRFRTPQELRQLATILGSHNLGSGSDPFWTTSAINILYLGLSAVSSQEPRHRHLGNLRWLLNHMGGENPERLHAFMSRALPPEDESLFAEYVAFCAQDSKVNASVLATARACLDLWSDPEVVRLTGRDTVDLEGLRTGKTAIYLIVPEHQLRYFSLLLNLFYSACFRFCLETGGRDAAPVFFFLDEFGNLGHIKDFAAIMTTLRKRRCSISIVLQEIAQLTTLYGPHEARTIFAGGCGQKLFFSGLDLDTTRYVEGVLGRSTAFDESGADPGDPGRPVGVPLMRSEDVRMMKPEEAVLVAGRERPIKLHMPPFYRVRTLKRLAAMPPAILASDALVERLSWLPLEEPWEVSMVP